MFIYQSAELLLHMAITDDDDSVRRTAITGYRQHPLGGDIEAVFDVNHPG